MLGQPAGQRQHEEKGQLPHRLRVCPRHVPHGYPARLRRRAVHAFQAGAELHDQLQARRRRDHRSRDTGHRGDEGHGLPHLLLERALRIHLDDLERRPSQPLAQLRTGLGKARVTEKDGVTSSGGARR